VRIPGCKKAWDDFLEEHPDCGSPFPVEEKAAAGTAGMDGYTPAPYLAWSGWRYRIPGGPTGGQYHGYIASDDIVDGVGWPAGHDEIYRTVDNPAGLGAFPWQPWDETWGGIPLKEGETVSDYVYRGPAEMRPRANASGGVHTVNAVQTQRSAGYAIAPGNYKGIGAMPARICPAWGCDGPPSWRKLGPPIHGGPMPVPWHGPIPFPGPRPSPIVPQPPPPPGPFPGPTVAGGCPSGQYQDAAGNCTSDWHNPYSLYLPTDGSSPAPAPTVAANTCPTGYSVDPTSGNCVVAGTAPSGGITAWLGSETTIGGMQIPNYLLAGVGALVAFKMFGGRR
jgi:hypothetical protein